MLLMGRCLWQPGLLTNRNAASHWAAIDISTAAIIAKAPDAFCFLLLCLFNQLGLALGGGNSAFCSAFETVTVKVGIYWD
jgi:hypothetical protein